MIPSNASIQASRNPGIRHRSRRLPFETNVKVICENIYMLSTFPRASYRSPSLTPTTNRVISYNHTIHNSKHQLHQAQHPQRRQFQCQCRCQAAPPAPRFNGYRILLAATEVYDPRAALRHRPRSFDAYEAEFELELQAPTQFFLFIPLRPR